MKKYVNLYLLVFLVVRVFCCGFGVMDIIFCDNKVLFVLLLIEFD
jgi:hypothetical protein